MADSGHRGHSPRGDRGAFWALVLLASHRREGSTDELPSKEDAVSVYRVIDVIGTSETSWEDAAVSAIKTAETSVRGARVAEVVEQDIHITDGDQIVFRTKVRLSFKYEEHHH